MTLVPRRAQAHLIVDDGARREARRGADVGSGQETRVRHYELAGRQLGGVAGRFGARGAAIRVGRLLALTLTHLDVDCRCHLAVVEAQPMHLQAKRSAISALGCLERL